MKLVLCAGITRSGSTWVYNAARLLLCGQHQAAVYGSWVADYDRSRPEPFHVVKIHNANDGLAAKASAILTSHRDLRDMTASAWIRGWISSESEAMGFVESAVRCHDYWAPRAKLDLPYDVIRQDPRHALQQVADQGGASNVDLDDVARQIDSLAEAKSADELYDRVTLLHQQHRKDGRSGYYRDVLPAIVITRIEKEFGPWLQRHGFEQRSETAP